MGGQLNANHLLFLAQGALWTVALSLIALLGGGLVGFVVALARISPSRATRILDGRLRPADPRHAAPRDHVPCLFRAFSDRPRYHPARRGRGVADDLRLGLSRRDLARLHRIGAAGPMGGGRGPGAQPDATHGQRDPASGRPHRDAADGRLLRPNHQEYLARLRGRLRRARPVRSDHQQLHLRALPDLRHHRRGVFLALLPGLATEWAARASRRAARSDLAPA